MSVSARENDREFRRFQKAIRQALKKVQDMRPVFQTIGDHFLKSREYIFDKGRSGPGLYKDLSPRYKKWKTNKFRSPYPILKLTGRLKKSITRRGGENIFKASKRSLIIGTTVPYSGYLQEGTGRKGVGGGMPARPFLFWGPESRRNANLELTRDLHKNMATTILTHVERMSGKTLEASITRARARVESIFK